MEYILLAISVFCGAGKSLLSKSCKPGRMWKFNTLAFLSAFFVILLSGIGDISFFRPNAVTLSLSVLYAIFTISGQYFYIKAVENGSVAISALIYSFGFTIPTLFGTVLYNEKLSTTKIAGLAVMIVSLILGSAVGKIKNTEENNGGVKKSLIYAFAAMLSSGIVGLIQKIHGKSEYSGQLSLFLVSAFLIMVVISSALSVKDESKEKSTPKAILPALLLGICIGFANKINLYLSGVLSSAVMFPVVNGGCVVLSAILSRMIFGERISLKKKIAILLGVIAILLIVY